jgi:hypothetical protein
MNPMHWLFEADSNNREQFIDQIIARFDQKIKDLVNARFASTAAHTTEYIVLRVDYHSTIKAKGEASNGEAKYEYNGPILPDTMTTISNTFTAIDKQYNRNYNNNYYPYAYPSRASYSSSVSVESSRTFVSAHARCRRELVSADIIDFVTNYRKNSYGDYIHGESNFNYRNSHQYNVGRYGNYPMPFTAPTTASYDVQLNLIPEGSFFYYLPIANRKTAKEGDSLLVRWKRHQITIPLSNTIDCTLYAQIPGKVMLYEPSAPDVEYRDEPRMSELRTQLAKGQMSLQKLLE